MSFHHAVECVQKKQNLQTIHPVEDASAFNKLFVLQYY